MSKLCKIKVEILKEELGIGNGLCDGNTSTGGNSEYESQISPSENNWIQIQTNCHKKVTDKLKDYKHIKQDIAS
jgi:hypothetical protein